MDDSPPRLRQAFRAFNRAIVDAGSALAIRAVCRSGTGDADSGAFAAALLLLSLAALVARLIPARRVATLDAMVALRAE